MIFYIIIIKLLKLKYIIKKLLKNYKKYKKLN